MEFAELLAKEKGTPVLCVDGAVGMLVQYPGGQDPSDPAGIEIPGELELRRIRQLELHRAGGALRQQGSPPHPLAIEFGGDESAKLSRGLLRDLWNALQPQEQRESGLFAASPNNTRG
jgi:hypothetical protein